MIKSNINQGYMQIILRQGKSKVVLFTMLISLGRLYSQNTQDLYPSLSDPLNSTFVNDSLMIFDNDQSLPYYNFDGSLHQCNLNFYEWDKYDSSGTPEQASWIYTDSILIFPSLFISSTPYLGLYLSVSLTTYPLVSNITFGLPLGTSCGWGGNGWGGNGWGGNGWGGNGWGGNGWGGNGWGGNGWGGVRTQNNAVFINNQNYNISRTYFNSPKNNFNQKVSTAVSPESVLQRLPVQHSQAQNLTEFPLKSLREAQQNYEIHHNQANLSKAQFDRRGVREGQNLQVASPPTPGSLPHGFVPKAQDAGGHFSASMSRMEQAQQAFQPKHPESNPRDLSSHQTFTYDSPIAKQQQLYHTETPVNKIPQTTEDRHPGFHGLDRTSYLPPHSRVTSGEGSNLGIPPTTETMGSRLPQGKDTGGNFSASMSRMEQAQQAFQPKHPESNPRDLSSHQTFTHDSPIAKQQQLYHTETPVNKVPQTTEDRHPGFHGLDRTSYLPPHSRVTSGEGSKLGIPPTTEAMGSRLPEGIIRGTSKSTQAPTDLQTRQLNSAKIYPESIGSSQYPPIPRGNPSIPSKVTLPSRGTANDSVIPRTQPPLKSSAPHSERTAVGQMLTHTAAPHNTPLSPNRRPSTSVIPNSVPAKSSGGAEPMKSQN